MIPCQNHCPATVGSVAAEAISRLEMALHGSICQYVQIEFCEGLLVLRGQAKSYYHKQLIQESVRGIKGVEAILNSVEVTDSIG